MLYQPISQWHSLHFELLIELVAQKLTELWRFKNLAYFLTWWPSSMTYLFVNVTYWNCSSIPYVDQVWWWYVKAFMSYTWQNGQTNRQTDKRTYLQKLKILASNKPTNEHTCQNCKFWQVTNKQTNKHFLFYKYYTYSQQISKLKISTRGITDLNSFSHIWTILQNHCKRQMEILHVFQYSIF